MVSRVPGDSNNDGEVNVFDLLVSRKYLARISTEINMSASDVNGDREVDVFDLLMLRKYLAGIKVDLI
ncbi:MAG: dockerin type I repeat-containing protein [Oscillospiraceae bacterium]|nr:dockerin type I repeat-containing protein [Oscillospiraceae bacterium]MBQ3501671.1 dockerin type I repeat-containing protein [Oscillospiraceae bacterium]